MQGGECQRRLLSKGGGSGCAIGGSNLGGTNYRLLTATGGGPPPQHSESLDLFLDMIQNRSIELIFK